MTRTTTEEGSFHPGRVEPRPKMEEPGQGMAANTTCPCGKVCKSTTGLKLHRRVCEAYRANPSSHTSATIGPTTQQGNIEHGESVTLRSRCRCIHCPSGYGTERGLAVHMHRKHPVEWNLIKQGRAEAGGPK